MQFDWEQYLTLAEELAGIETAHANREAKLRCAMSRAYYAVYCEARNFLRDKRGLRIPYRDAHRFVRQSFLAMASQSRLCDQIARNLRMLSTRRCNMDYEDFYTDDHFPDDMEIACRDTLERARRLVRRLSNR